MGNMLPDSAISSWGGFVYQGKVALYHSVKLLVDGTFNGTSVPEFELQLDSTDDFAIYVGGIAISVHQVKAKSSQYRSTFNTALGKSSRITTDCDANTVRYFHIANNIDDSSDYVNQAGGIVKFYEYDSNCYCPIADIEEKTKLWISSYLDKNGLINTSVLIDKKYCYLSELITQQVIKAHGLIHAGRRENEVAYNERIKSKIILSGLQTDFHDLPDETYQTQKLKATFADAFESCIANEVSSFSDAQVKLASTVFDFIYSMTNDDLASVMRSLRPTGDNESIRVEDVENYAEIITEITHSLELTGLPHYSRTALRYLPTAVFLTERRIPTFKEILVGRIRKNPKLAAVLFEYNTLIALAERPGLDITARSDKVTAAPYSDPKLAQHITKEFPVSIISKDVAQERLNAK